MSAVQAPRAKYDTVSHLPPATRDPRPPAPVGDLNSDEKGSGARFNAGKIPFELVPIKVMGETFQRRLPGDARANALFYVGCYQTSRDVNMLYAACDVLGLEGWEECARVFDYGRNKYAAWNWAKGMAWSVPLACIVRHLLAMLDDEENDPESGLPHRGHVFCNIAMLVSFTKTYAEGDDFAAAGMLA